MIIQLRTAGGGEVTLISLISDEHNDDEEKCR